MQDKIIGLMDEHRRRNGFLTLAGMAALAETNTVFDGAGLARGIRLEAGEVVNGLGDFVAASVERQLAYHPRST
ncbi:hypothetical protein [Streptomyces sp. NPDC001100]